MLLFTNECWLSLRRRPHDAEHDYFFAARFRLVAFFAVLFLPVGFFVVLFLPVVFFAADFRDDFFAVDFFAAFREGTLAPDSRASLMAIAMACLRLFTLSPLLDLSLPSLCSFITLWILSSAFLEYLAMMRFKFGY